MPTSCWLLHLRFPGGLAFRAVLAAQGYAYHVTHTGKGADSTYVHVRNGLPDGCDAVRAVFPPGEPVPDRQEPFDLPVR